MSYLSPEEYALFSLARSLGGVSKVKKFLEIVQSKNIRIDNLLGYLESIEYKIPSPLEIKIEDLERRILILEGKPPVKLVQPPPQSHKEWAEDKLKEYLDDCKEWAKFTYYYYKILTEIPDKIRRDGLIRKIGELTGQTFTGRSLAGVQAGITMSTTKKNFERLDWKDEDSQQFSLNAKYRDKMKNYFRVKQESIS